MQSPFKHLTRSYGYSDEPSEINIEVGEGTWEEVYIEAELLVEHKLLFALE